MVPKRLTHNLEINSIKDSGNCVLYLLDRVSQDISRLAHAQAIAIKHKLPIAVVCCIDNNEQSNLQSLQTIQKRLKRLNIAFIILIGQASQTLASIVHHTQPMAIIADDYQTDIRHTLHKHSILWPGTVLDIQHLASLPLIS